MGGCIAGTSAMIRPFLGRVAASARAIDASGWVVLAAILLRIEVAARFNVMFGYDAATHMAYTDLLARGHIPRLWESDIQSAAYAAHHPPLFYGLAWLLAQLGLGRAGGTLISLASGTARLLLVNRLYRGPMSLSPRARLIANIVHGFIPFAVRIDVFYSNESLGTTLAVAAVSLALAARPCLTGLTLGVGFLTKASAVAAVPGIIVAELFSDGPTLRPRKNWFRALAISGAISGGLLMLWAYPNVVHYHNPYPTVYQPNVNAEVETDPRFKLPILLRHPLSWYTPRFGLDDLSSPYYGGEENLIRVLHFEAWGDYYNFMHREPPAAESANGKPLTPAMHRIHSAFVTVGLFFLAAMVAGFVDALRRLRRREMPCGELALALLGAGYLTIAVLWAAAIPFDYHGAVKSTYALGSVVILSCWTGRGIDLIKGPKWLLRAADALSITPIVLTLWQRLVW